jgi:hypothetical protein
VRLHASASLATATQMALDGTCIAAIPPVIVQAQLARGELEIVDVEEKLPDLLFCAAWHPRSATKAVRALIELAERLSIMEKGAGFDGRVVGQANREAQLLRNSEMSTQNCDV